MASVSSIRIGRGKTGSAVAELPAVLWVLFCLLAFPLINLTTVGLRIALVSFMTERSCAMAARASSFETALNGGSPAIAVANSVAGSWAQKFGGISLGSINTNIVSTSILNGSVVTYAHALSNPADTSDYTYQISVAITASVNPLVPLPYFPLAIPGLTAPMSVTLSDREFAECPQGLNI